MEFHFLYIFVLFCLVIKPSDAALAAELYWKSMLPNTPFPQVLRDLLKPDTRNEIIFSDERRRGNYWDEVKEFNKKDVFNTTTIFFLYDDLIPGKKMKIKFSKSMNTSNFLPRKVSQTIPFSTKKLPKILKYFSVEPMSKKAQIMNQTLKECEAAGIKGEDKYCATSLESLVDFVIEKLGRNVQLFCNEIEKGDKNQEYTVSKGIKTISENEIVCHMERYAYAVFYCHRIMKTKVYMVPLVGANGSKIKSLVVCHSDTSDWNPKHFAFQVLNVKPGGPPICHFLKSDTLVWVSN